MSDRIDQAVPITNDRPGWVSMAMVFGNGALAWGGLYTLILTGQADGQGAVAWCLTIVIVAVLAIWITGERSAGMRVLNVLQLRAGLATAEIEATVSPEVMERRAATDEDLPPRGPQQEDGQG